MLKKVLILGASYPQVDAISFLYERGYDVHVCSYPKKNAPDNERIHYNEINVFNEDKLSKYIEANNIDYVYSVGLDFAMPIVGRLCEKHNLPLLVGSKAADICNHKDKMRQVLSPDCKGNIEFEIKSEYEPTKISFPCIIKPSDSQGQRGVFLVHNEKEYEELFAVSKSYSREEKVIVEKYIGGEEFSVNAYLVDSKIAFAVISDRITWSEFTGLIHKHIVPSKMIKNELINETKDICLEACKRIGISNGPVYFQMKLFDNHIYIIEIAPRLDGCHMWRVIKEFTGVDLLQITFDHLINNERPVFTNELNNHKDYKLEFLCEKPLKIMKRDNFELPNNALYKEYYYDDGDVIEKKNGLFEKVGYFISEI